MPLYNLDTVRDRLDPQLSGGGPAVIDPAYLNALLATPQVAAPPAQPALAAPIMNSPSDLTSYYDNLWNNYQANPTAPQPTPLTYQSMYDTGNTGGLNLDFATPITADTPVPQDTTPTPTPTPTPPAPATKTNPLTQPVVEGQGFLPAPTPPPLTLEQQKTQFLNQASQGFGYNYGRNLIPDNSLDDTIKSILGEQQGQAQTYLDRGKSRGIYNDVGYNAGENKINTQSEAGGSQLASLGTDVLNKYRTQANTVRDDAYSSISGLMDGQNFSLDPYFGEGNAIKATEQRNAPGDLRTALGGQNFFDFQGLTNAAGQAQGATNLRDADVATALAAQKEREAKGRGLGSEGAF